MTATTIGQATSRKQPAVAREPKPKKLTLTISPALHKRIRLACVDDGRLMSEVLRDLLEDKFPAW